MCGIVGLFLKDARLEPELGRLTAAMLAELCDRGPDSAGFAVYGNETAGITKICAVARDGAADWPQIAARLAKGVGASVTVDEIEDHAIFKTAGDGSAARKWLIDNVPEATVLSQGQSIEIFKGVGDPSKVAARLDLAGRRGSHAIGHTRMATEFGRHDRRLPPVLDRRGHLPRAQRLAVEPQPAARGSRAPRRAVPDRQRQRGRRRLSDLAHARGRQPEAGAEPLAARPRRLLHVRGRHARRLRRAARSGRLQARRHGRDRRLGGVRHRSSARSPRLPGVEAARIWEPQPATVYAWSRSS